MGGAGGWYRPPIALGVPPQDPDQTTNSLPTHAPAGAYAAVRPVGVDELSGASQLLLTRSYVSTWNVAGQVVFVGFKK